MSGAERNSYFDGELLTGDDFRREQRYHVERRRLLNRLTIGAGVVAGLDVSAAAGGALTLSPGLALDGLGREIEVDEPQALPAPDGEVWVAYAEEQTPSGTVRETFSAGVSPAAPADAVVVATVADGAVQQAPRLESNAALTERVRRLEERLAACCPDYPESASSRSPSSSP